MIRLTVSVVVTLLVGWWLFADTYTRYAPTLADDAERGGVRRTLRFAHFGTYQDYELWRGVIAGFERANPDIDVRQEYIVGLAGRYDTKMRQQIMSSTLPHVALIQLGPFHELAGQFADLFDLVQMSSGGDKPLLPMLDDTALAAFRHRGRLHALPVSGGNLLVFCNTVCFERARRFRGKPIPLPGKDWTMAQFRETAALLTCDFDGDGRIDQFGFWLPRWVYYLPWIWSFGAALTNEAGTEWTLVGDEAERAFKFYRDLAVGDGVCPRDEEVPQLFQDVGFLTGKVAMCVNGPWFLPFLAGTGLSDSYFVAPIPMTAAGRATRITWDGLVMPEYLPTRSRADAWRFMRFLLSKPVQDRIARTGRALPARKESAEAFVNAPSDARRIRFVEALSYSRLQPRLPRFAEIDRAFNKRLVQLLDPARQVTAQVMLERLASDAAVVTAFGGPDTGAP